MHRRKANSKLKEKKESDRKAFIGLMLNLSSSRGYWSLVKHQASSIKHQASSIKHHVDHRFLMVRWRGLGVRPPFICRYLIVRSKSLFRFYFLFLRHLASFCLANQTAQGILRHLIKLFTYNNCGFGLAA